MISNPKSFGYEYRKKKVNKIKIIQRGRTHCFSCAFASSQLLLTCQLLTRYFAFFCLSQDLLFRFFLPRTSKHYRISSQLVFQMALAFSSLPVECIQLVFDRVPSEDLLRLRRVSSAWLEHQQLACRRRRTIVLMKGEYAKQEIVNSLLHGEFMAHHIDMTGKPAYQLARINRCQIQCYKLLASHIAFLVKTFPRLDSLVISFRSVSTSIIQFLLMLFKNFTSQLVSVQLYFYYDWVNTTQQNAISVKMTDLVNGLNTLTALQHVTFELTVLHKGRRTYDNSNFFQLQKSPLFLTRIKEFYYFSMPDMCLAWDHWLRQLKQTGKLDKLVRMSLLSFPGIHEWTYKTAGASTLCNRFTMAPQGGCDEPSLWEIVSLFPSLSSITVSISHCHNYSENSLVRLGQLASLLSPLTKLVHVCIEISCDIKSESSGSSSFMVPQLSSVLALDLDIEYNSSNYHRQVKTIWKIFPNLQSIRLRYFRSFSENEATEKRRIAADFF